MALPPATPHHRRRQKQRSAAPGSPPSPPPAAITSSTSQLERRRAKLLHTSMRPGAELFPVSHGAPAAAPVHAAVNGTTTATHSPWQSPVPYLFGGLAAMMGLIAFALLILACSYWKLSGYLDEGSGSGGHAGSVAAGDDEEKGSASGVDRPAVAPQDHVVVIMAGDETPTFLARPTTTRAAVELGAAPAESSRVRGGDIDSATASEPDKKHLDEDHQQVHDTATSTSPPQLGAAAAAAASRSHDESSSTTALQESSP